MDLTPHIPSDYEWAKVRLLHCHFDDCRESHLIISSPKKIYAIGCYHIGVPKISLKILDNSLPLDKQTNLLLEVISKAWSVATYKPNRLDIQLRKSSAEYNLLKQHKCKLIEEIIEYRGTAIQCHEAIESVKKRIAKKTDYVIEQLSPKNIESQIRFIRKDAIKLDVMQAKAFDKMVSSQPEGIQSLKTLSFVALIEQKIVGAILAYVTKNNLFVASRYVLPEILDMRVNIDLMERFLLTAKHQYGDHAPVHFSADSVKHKETVNLTKRLKAKPLFSHVTLQLVR